MITWWWVAQHQDHEADGHIVSIVKKQIILVHGLCFPFYSDYDSTE